MSEVFNVDQMVDAVEGLIRRSLTPHADQLRALEQWRKAVGEAPAGKDGAPGIAGKDGAPGANGKDGPPGLNGKDGAHGNDGQKGDKGDRGERGEKGLDGAPGIPGERGLAGDRGEKGADGTSVTLEQVMPLIEAPVSKWMLECERRATDTLSQAIGRIPLPKDGAPGRDGIDGARGSDGAKGDPGVGIDRLVVDQKSVEFVLTDGTSAVVEMPTGPQGERGKDGAPGIPGERGAKGDTPDAAEVESIVARLLPDLLHKAVESALQRAVPDIVTRTAALVPPGRDGLPGAPGRPGSRGEDGIDGKNGTDGRDAFDLEDLSVSLDGRVLTLAFSAGERSVQRHVTLAGLPQYVGTFGSGKSHSGGDMVTYGGSVWLATCDTATSPPGAHWRLVVKGTR
jgi:hypothetical protein